jgi:geranylgeranyl reductase family protein
LSKRNQTFYDVAIVGTGPAGCLLACELARAGRAVLLLEKKKLPRYKTCGGGLTQRALDLIPFDIESVIEDRAHSIRLRVDYQTAFTQTCQPPAVHLVMRDRLDDCLAQHAVAIGAVLLDHTRFLSLSGPPGNLTIQTSAGPFRARVIVGADGVYSRVARALQLPIKYRLMPALEAELTVPPATLRRFAGAIHFDFGVTPGGYAWLFPKKNHLSAGILARRRPAKQLKPHLLDYLARNGLRREADIRSLRLHPIPCRPDRRNRYADERGLIVGDGTGLVDPVTGEGIFYALKSARIAAMAIEMHLEHRQRLSHPYNHKIKMEIESEILRADILARILYSFPAFSNRVLKKYGAKIGAKHMAVYLGAMTYRQLFNYVLSPKGVAYLLRPPGKSDRSDDQPLRTA